MAALDSINLVFSVALRNLWMHRMRTVIIGSLLGFGAFLAVLGMSLLRTIEGSMRDSITASVAGHLQVYSSEAKDDLALFGGSFMGREDVGSMPQFGAIRDTALQNPNVAAFVPMGIDMAMLSRGNEMDDSLDAFRRALRAGDKALVKERVEQIRFQIQQFKSELASTRKVLANSSELDAQEAALARAEAPGFLESIAPDDEASLQFLETRVAPISGEKIPIYLRYLGTDIELFKGNFKKFKIVEGEALPAGRRGILLSRTTRETQLKNLAARILDNLHKRVVKSGARIKGDPENERFAADLSRQQQQLVAKLDRNEAVELSRELEAIDIPPPAGASNLTEALTAQLKSFLVVDDSNIVQRHAWFYEHIAPKIPLYQIGPGETIMVRSYTRSGYIKTLPLKVYGVYAFDGLEDSDLAGATNITDLVSFRELYGQMTAESRKELDEMRKQVGLKEIDAASAEDALFGGESALVESAAPTRKTAASQAVLQVKPVIADAFAESELKDGLALNAAVVLKDPAQLQITRTQLNDAFTAAGQKVKIVDWQEASGMVGQFVNIVGLVLVFSIIIIFVVALVIINNTIIVGTLNRVREIGTMRAIGAQRSFVASLFLAETALTGLIGGAIGTFFALVLLAVLGKQGIPAINDVFSFLFSGPRLYPRTLWPLAFTTPFLITLIATVASVYAVRFAARIQPAEAMQEKE